MLEASSRLFNNDKNFNLKIDQRDYNVSQNKTKLLSNSTVDVILKLMEENTITGTAKKARLNGYNIGGKTATGEKAKNGKYDKSKLVSSFLAVFQLITQSSLA